MTDELEDSKDLTDADVAAATDATEAQVRQTQLETRCKCDKLHGGRSNALRRRRPYHYWIIQLECRDCGDTRRLVFRLTELKWRIP
jgi:hypothetical protein